MSRRVLAGSALIFGLVAVTGLVLGPLGAAPGTGWTVVGWNNLGMHCMDAGFGVFSILPPYNTIQAQVMDPAGRLAKSDAGLTVTYEAVADPTGSINTTSAGKTDFWDHVKDLFGAAVPVDAGLKGKNMPGAGNRAQPMGFDAALNWFIAEGIPITPYDDAGRKNTYPMMRIKVRDASGSLLASTDVVLPVSDEMDCTACHASGGGNAARPSSGWVFDADPQRDVRRNILRLHDDRNLGNPDYLKALTAAGYNGAGLAQTVEVNGRPVLCAACHASEALGTPGQPGAVPLTRAMHGRHAGVLDPTNGLALDASANRSACYRCHPGSETKCLRGAMGAAVAADGSLAMQCQSCHGSMSAVASATRTGWLDEPSCGNCHTGTAAKNSGQIRFTSALDASGSRRIPADPTFTTNANTPVAGTSLYRFSKGHGGLQCSACHGSTHAEYPAAHPNDNLQSLALQGHVGTIGECATCHNASPRTTSGGPHGMHPVGPAWVDAHADAAEGGRTACQACHGTDYRGTVLSRSFAGRTLSTKFGTKSLWRGFTVGCYLCHNGPSSESANPNRAPVVSNLSAAAEAGSPVTIALQATDPDRNALTLRIVSQPANGTVGLAGTTATYRPGPGFAGTESFTYAAWDGAADSNLGAVTVTVRGVSPTPTPTPTATP
ncbi:MAG TPA: Ig-like domain-containing protein, partial [Thermoanaerobaculia bacterium]|nr:Ig-like domain-containing protein [Thermoanaerobaculia bacterium]